MQSPVRAGATVKSWTLAWGAAAIFIGVSLSVQAAQITPNPNPADSTIDIISDPFAVNEVNPYINHGTINIDSTSTLINTVGAVLNNGDITDPHLHGTLNLVLMAARTNAESIMLQYGMNITN